MSETTSEIVRDHLSAVQRIQQLGLTEQVALDIASIEVVCGGKNGYRASLGEYMDSEHGTDASATILERAGTALSSGETPEKAFGGVLGFSVNIDRDTGSFIRVKPEDALKKKIAQA